MQGAGLFLPALRLWLDPSRPRRGEETVFVSHAHSDHVARHREVVCTAATARLMQARLGGQREERLLEWGEWAAFETGGRCWRLKLIPAGHILGSAMALVESDQGRFLYTGDFRLAPGWAAERCEPASADVLVMETTFGRPQYVFPPMSDVLDAIGEFCRATITAGRTPVLLAYSLGKSQELMCGLANYGLTFALEESAHRLAKVYETFGARFPAYDLWDGGTTDRRTVICAPGARLLAALRGSGRCRTAVVTGWAMDRGCRFRHRADEAFPLSDHADYPGLIEMVRTVKPRRVYTVHGFAAEFAYDLREMGVDARALGREEQLGLDFGSK